MYMHVLYVEWKTKKVPVLNVLKSLYSDTNSPLAMQISRQCSLCNYTQSQYYRHVVREGAVLYVAAYISIPSTMAGVFKP